MRDRDDENRKAAARIAERDRARTDREAGQRWVARRYNGHPVELPKCADCSHRRIHHTAIVSHGHVRIPDGEGGFVGELLGRCAMKDCDCKGYVAEGLTAAVG